MRILFVCTHNRCRSILSEALAQHAKLPHIQAASAGSDPAGEVHPDTLLHLAEAGVSTQGLRSKSLMEVEDFQPQMVIMVCDSAAQSTCPTWTGEALEVHWTLEDPSKIDDEARRRLAFKECIQEIQTRILKLSQAIEKSAENRDALIIELERLGADVVDHSSLNS
ncbi:arsenate reductase ArsC [Bermanella marisrubri]|uniref:Protein-tyrosine-phosphatase n=1 Tax=Bermanella marisrubri TaxID=207949 RepID=Q1N217_9GAMM|nr:arsenate reductase ArsC [Bermanella marisrubri]EAT12347.1 Protein-tyrosine-phosphatase [Bermanella marisrubri]QIZ85430.1 arsenate reductase ArsC [Bermanella marisrubri]